MHSGDLPDLARRDSRDNRLSCVFAGEECEVWLFDEEERTPRDTGTCLLLPLHDCGRCCCSTMSRHGFLFRCCLFVVHRFRLRNTRVGLGIKEHPSRDQDRARA